MSVSSIWSRSASRAEDVGIRVSRQVKEGKMCGVHYAYEVHIDAFEVRPSVMFR